MEERPPPLRLVYADELGQLKGARAAWGPWAPPAPAHRPCATARCVLIVRQPPIPFPAAVVQTADGAKLGTAAVAETWCAEQPACGGLPMPLPAWLVMHLPWQRAQTRCATAGLLGAPCRPARPSSPPPSAGAPPTSSSASTAWPSAALAASATPPPRCWRWRGAAAPSSCCPLSRARRWAASLALNQTPRQAAARSSARTRCACAACTCCGAAPTPATAACPRCCRSRRAAPRACTRRGPVPRPPGSSAARGRCRRRSAAPPTTRPAGAWRWAARAQSCASSMPPRGSWPSPSRAASPTRVRTQQWRLQGGRETGGGVPCDHWERGRAGGQPQPLASHAHLPTRPPACRALPCPALLPAVGLVDRPWNTALAFLPPASGGGGGDGSDAHGAPGSRVLVGTGYHKVSTAPFIAALSCRGTAARFAAGAGSSAGLLPHPPRLQLVCCTPGAIATSRTTTTAAHPPSHQVRLYDAEAGKRPQVELTWGEGRITSLALEPDGAPRAAGPARLASLPAEAARVLQPCFPHAMPPPPHSDPAAGQRCWVGNGLGQVEVLDLPTRRFSGAVKGLSGESAPGLLAAPLWGARCCQAAAWQVRHWV